MKACTVALLVAASVICAAEALSCSYCRRWECPVSPRSCHWGTGLDLCQCCPICLQGPGERCGGPSASDGTCGTGLWCQPDPYDILPPGLESNQRGFCSFIWG
ncbi:single insulin-like growth factor-binding domain protein-1 [Hyalella azteca]|uniref:Single insulin-like growth factor-binding domain protein-1 n=1 Tax=Hyalella azteca TaxID=294128 RepID=A0A8B7N3M4_HYAAZ|nr:single insulin-like growth factor-binding domain protein-1 [Hyalella azteca]